MPHFTILISDDEPTVVETHVRALTQAMLAPYHVESVPLGDPQATLARCQQDPPDLLITDLRKAGDEGRRYRGASLCRGLRSDPHTRSIAILVVSGISTRIVNRERTALAFAADAFLPKPYKLEGFRRTLRDLLVAGADGIPLHPLTSLPRCQMLARMFAQYAAHCPWSLLRVWTEPPLNPFVFGWRVKEAIEGLETWLVHDIDEHRMLVAGPPDHVNRARLNLGDWLAGVWYDVDQELVAGLPPTRQFETLWRRSNAFQLREWFGGPLHSRPGPPPRLHMARVVGGPQPGWRLEQTLGKLRPITWR